MKAAKTPAPPASQPINPPPTPLSTKRPGFIGRFWPTPVEPAEPINDSARSLFELGSERWNKPRRFDRVRALVLLNYGARRR
jgi:hypothetical protein